MERAEPMLMTKTSPEDAEDMQDKDHKQQQQQQQQQQQDVKYHLQEEEEEEEEEEDVMVKKRKKAEPRWWTQAEDSALFKAVRKHGECNWKSIAAAVGSRNHMQCIQRWKKNLKPALLSDWSNKQDEIMLMNRSEDQPDVDWMTMLPRPPGQLPADLESGNDSRSALPPQAGAGHAYLSTQGRIRPEPHPRGDGAGPAKGPLRHPARPPPPHETAATPVAAASSGSVPPTPLLCSGTQPFFLQTPAHRVFEQRLVQQQAMIQHLVAELFEARRFQSFLEMELRNLRRAPSSDVASASANQHALSVSTTVNHVSPPLNGASPMCSASTDRVSAALKVLTQNARGSSPPIAPFSSYPPNGDPTAGYEQYRSGFRGGGGESNPLPTTALDDDAAINALPRGESMFSGSPLSGVFPPLFAFGDRHLDDSPLVMPVSLSAGSFAGVGQSVLSEISPQPSSQPVILENRDGTASMLDHPQTHPAKRQRKLDDSSLHN